MRNVEIIQIKRGDSFMSKDTSIRDFVIGLVLIIIGLYNIFKNTTIGVIRMRAFW